MRYHNITTDDMLNGDGLRVVLWLAGCRHRCDGCQNPATWDPNGGLLFNESAKREIFRELDKDYISGITFSGGDPMLWETRFDVLVFVSEIKEKYPNKTIWLYTGESWESIRLDPVMEYIDVLVDGKFIKERKDVNFPWAGSTNQRVIDVKKSLAQNDDLIPVLHCGDFSEG